MKYLRIFSLSFIAFFATAYLATAQTASTTDVQEQEEIKTISVKVKGVGCMTDVKTISENVEKLEGVTSCEIIKKGAVTSFSIKLNPALITEKEIFTQIEDTPGCKNPNDRPYSVKL
ncbi:MAG: hypothetical protein AAFO82_04280 [Bacteroidota bacterium]